MMFENEDAAVARNLGIAPHIYRIVNQVIKEIRNDTVVALSNWELQRDLDGKEVWEAEVGGSLLMSSGHIVYFKFRQVIVGQAVWRGSSWTPDWYRIIRNNGNIIFEGEVECPDNPDDKLGWKRYDTFSPIRSAAVNAVFARLATGRPVVEP